MSVNSEVVYCYDRLATLTERMLELSREEEWGQLPGVESLCAALIDRLKEIEPTTTLDSSQRDQVRQSLLRVRADQEEVCRLVKPQLRILLGSIAQLQQQDSVNKAYGTTH